MNSKNSASRRSFLKGAAKLTVGTLALPSLLAACTTPVAPATDAENPGGAAVDLTLMTWWIPPLVIGSAVEHAVEQFNENHADINVSIDANPGSPDAQLQKWQTQLAAGAPPDVTLMRPHFHTAFASRGALLQIDDYLENEPDLQRDDFWPEITQRLSWDGKLWGLAAEIWFTFQFLNVDMFEAAGVALPDDDWTWDDYLGIATSLTQGEGANRQFGSGPLDGWWVEMVRSWGGEVLDAEEMSCVVNMDPGPNAIQWIADLILDHEVAPSAENMADQNATSLFETGRVGMYEVANWYLSEAQDKFQGNWAIAPNPIGLAGRQSTVQGANYAIFNLTKNPDEAWTLMHDMSVGDGQRLILQETGIFPTVQSLATLEDLPNYEQRWIDVSLISAEVARPNHFVPKYVEWWNAALRELSLVWVGQKTAQEATDAMVPVINEILASPA